MRLSELPGEAIHDTSLNAYIFPERKLGVSAKRFIGLAKKHKVVLRHAGNTLMMDVAAFDELQAKINADRTFIYFIQMGADGPIKIGNALRPDWRLTELQCGNPYPLKIIHQFEDHVWRERELHIRFADHRLEGEWFEAAPVLEWLREKMGTADG